MHSEAKKKNWQRSLSFQENQIEQARQVKNQTKQTKQTIPVSTVCLLDAPQMFSLLLNKKRIGFHYLKYP